MNMSFRHGSFRRQIILTFVVGFFLMISAFVSFLVKTENDYLYRASLEEARSLAESLAAGATSWVLANDVAGMQEVVHAFRRHGELRYAMVIAPSGQVLAHSEPTKVGQFVADEQSRALLQAPPRQRIMADDKSRVDVAAPIMVNDRLIGWTRIALGREEIAAELRVLLLASVLFVLLATTLSLLAALYIAKRLGYRIGSLVKVAEQVQIGSFDTRANIADRDDEIASLADSLNSMLDALARNRMELRAASHYTRSLIEASLDPLVTISAEGKITDVNAATERATGRSRGELVGTDFSDYFTEPDKARDGYRQVLAHGFVIDYPLSIRHADGRIADVLYNASVYRDEAGAVVGVFAAARDISARKQAEEKLRRSERELAEAQRIAHLGSWILDIANNQLAWSDEIYRIFEIDPEEFSASYEAFIDTVHPDDREMVNTAYTESLAKRTPYDIEHRLLMKDGRIKYVNEKCETHYDGNGRAIHSIGTVHDITERTKAEAALKEREEFLSSVVENIPDMIFIKEAGELRFVRFNKAGEELLGVKREDLIGKCDYDFFPREQADSFTQKDREVLQAGCLHDISEEPINTKHGARILHTKKIPIMDAAGKPAYLLGISEDITERMQAEHALARANRALRTLSACNEALVRADNEDEIIAAICRLVVETGGYRMAWVGYAEHDAAQTIRPVAWHGHEEGYLTTARFSWADTELGRGPSGMALRTGTVQTNQNFLTNPAMAPWRDAAAQRSYQSSISLPLKNSTGTFGVLTIYATEPDAFVEGEVALLRELAEDLAFGINVNRTRADRDRISFEHRHHAEILRQSLEDSIKAIANTVEARDAYTAGHQQRVGHLAVAIAREMGVPEDTIHGIALAATVHDLGKITVPAEILAKPARLTDIELMLVKNHAQAGYDILKGIKFPWPIATIVWQHHERLDGSGYPRGLKGDQILIESRIMAIADVVEAIASHRPYRPALGIDMALKELERGRGTAFDAAIVDVCIKLFREKKFVLEN